MESVAPACLLEGDDGPTDLDALLDLAQLQAQLLLTDQGAELGLVVVDQVFICVFADAGVVARDRNVSDSDFAFVTASNADAVHRYVLNDHHVVSLLGNAFQHEVRANWSLDGEKLELHSILLDEAGVLLFADLAVKLFEIVLDGASDYFLAHF